MKHLKLIALLAMVTFSTACGGGDDESKSEQTITFGGLAPHNLSEQSFELNATASSGLSVTFRSSDTSVASVTGKTVTLLKAGTTTITASQSGNAAYYEAPNRAQTLTVIDDTNVAKKSQTITSFTLPAAWTFADGELTLAATASSGLPVAFSATHPNVQIDGNTLKLLYLGEHYDADVIITAFQAGNEEYNAAPLVDKIIHISHAD